MSGLTVDDVLGWLRRRDGRLEDIFALWTQGKRSDQWIAERLIEEGHLAALAAPQGDERLREAARALLEPIDHKSHPHREWPSIECDECGDIRRSRFAALRAALAEEEERHG